MTLEVNLKNYRGNVQKSATIFSNDPKNPRVTVNLSAKVQPFIEVEPANIIFRGLPDEQDEKPVELTASSKPFRITQVENNVEGKIGHELKTVEEGKHYQLKVKNLLSEEGQYRGLLKLKTDHPQKPEILIRVTGNIEGEISVRPQALSVGKLIAQQPARSGKVLVMSNRNKPFNITDLAYDKELLEVTQKPLPESQKQGFILEINPKMEKVSQGSQQKTLITFQTDTAQGKKHEVQIHVIHR